MPAQYTLEPGVRDTVRVSDPDTGMSRLMYDPQKAKELQAQQQPGYQSPMAAAAGPAAPLPSYISGDQSESTPGPFDEPAPSAPAGPPLPPATPGLPPPSPLQAPRGSTAIPAPPTAPAGTQLHKAELTPGVEGRPYDTGAEDARHEGLVDRKLEMQRRGDATQAILNEQNIRLQQQQQDDQDRQEEEGRKRLRYERELETVKKEAGPMSSLGAIGSVVLGLVGLFMAKRSANPGLALSRMNQSLDSAVSKDIENQRHERDSTISRLTQQLGDAQQAELMYRGSVRRLALDRVKGNLQRLGEDAGTSELMRAAELEVQTMDDQAKAASFNKPGTAKYEFQQPKPPKGGGPGGVGGAVAGAPEQEKYVDQELTKWGSARGLKPNQVQEEWRQWSKPIIEGAPAREAINGAQQVIARYKKSGDVAGKGTFAQMLPSWWAGSEGNNVRANIQAAKAFFQKEVSGTAVSDQERKLLDGLVEGQGNYDDIANGLGILKRIRDSSLNELDRQNPAFGRIRRMSETLGEKQRAASDSGLDAQDAAAGSKAPLPSAKNDTGKGKVSRIMSPGEVAPDRGYDTSTSKPKKPMGDYAAIMDAVDTQSADAERKRKKAHR